MKILLLHRAPLPCLNVNLGAVKIAKLIVIFLVFGLNQIAHASILEIDKTATKDQFKNMLLIDASNLSQCQKNSVVEAKCIPANTFQSKTGVLASFYNISWVFGTANLQGDEKILVFADTEKQRDAVLGLFFLAGHKNLWRWNTKKSVLQNILGKGVGQKRSIVRSKYYIAKMRDENLVLPIEIDELKKRGWILSKENTLNAQRTIVFGEKPLDALARFTQLLIQKTEKQYLKILIHSPDQKLLD